MTNFRVDSAIFSLLRCGLSEAKTTKQSIFDLWIATKSPLKVQLLAMTNKGRFCKNAESTQNSHF
ncbi:hypothetical protein [Helicobacter sp. 23-1045]